MPPYAYHVRESEKQYLVLNRIYQIDGEPHDKSMNTQSEREFLLIVDDEPNVLASLKRDLRREGYGIVTAPDGPSGLEVLEKYNVGVVVSDMMMPQMDGITFLEHVKRHDPDIVRIMLTAYGTFEIASEAINRTQVFSYLVKPWSPDKLKDTISKAVEYYRIVKENKDFQRTIEQQNITLNSCNANLEKLVSEKTSSFEELFKDSVIMLAIATEAKDDVTGKHIQRVYALTREICRQIGMPDEEAEQIAFFSMLHDIGKLHIPDQILMKKGKLTEHEYETMKTHTIIGENILSGKPFYEQARIIALFHHEKWDGSGYPTGLKGTDIPLAARVVSVADAFDAMINERPYKKPIEIIDAICEMKCLSGIQFDPDIVEALLTSLGIVEKTHPDPFHISRTMKNGTNTGMIAYR